MKAVLRQLRERIASMTAQRLTAALAVSVLLASAPGCGEMAIEATRLAVVSASVAATTAGAVYAGSEATRSFQHARAASYEADQEAVKLEEAKLKLEAQRRSLKSESVTAADSY